MMKPIALFISCEHAVNTIPPAYRSLFINHEAILQTHRAIDIGALKIALCFRERFPCSYAQASVSRLLIDCNRSLTHPHCFSEFTQTLPLSDKQQLIRLYYQPYRQSIEPLIESAIQQGAQVLHLSIHSFTPELNGVQRTADVGLLYDSKRHREQAIAKRWKKRLLEQKPTYRVRMNYPYRGNSDGLTTALRQRYAEEDYLGFEVESNQALLTDDTSCDAVAQALSSSFYIMYQDERLVW